MGFLFMEVTLTSIRVYIAIVYYTRLKKYIVYYTRLKKYIVYFRRLKKVLRILQLGGRGRDGWQPPSSTS